MHVPTEPLVAIDPTELAAVLQGLLEVHLDLVYETNELKRRVAELEHQQIAMSGETTPILDLGNVNDESLI